MDPRLEDYVEIQVPAVLKQYQEVLVVLKDEVVARKGWVHSFQNSQARINVEDLHYDKFFPSDIRVFIPKTNNASDAIPPGESANDGTVMEEKRPKANCPGAHGLQYERVPNYDYTCDVCKFLLPIGSEMYSCRICDWDSCRDCANDDEEEVYEVGEHVLVFYGPLLYDAIVVEIDPEDDEPYLVHFVGWHRRHDLWVPLPNMVKLNADTRQQQKELQAAEDKKQDEKKSKRKSKKRKKK